MHTDFQVISISGLPCRHENKLAFLVQIIVHSSMTIYLSDLHQTWYMIVPQYTLKAYQSFLENSAFYTGFCEVCYKNNLSPQAP